VLSASHGVTLPLQTEDVDCQMQPRCTLHVFCELSAVHAVRVPLHGTAVVDQPQPGVVHVAWLVS
jgi:hypothetical protein